MQCLNDFRPYQRAALEFGERTPRWYLAAKAGAGKTGIVLALMDALMFDRFEVEATLVVAPKRVVRQWAQEARKWAFGRFFRFREYLGPSHERNAALEAVLAGQGNVLVVSFEFFPELMQSIRLDQWPFGLVVFDEASRLRNGGRRGSVGWKAMNAVSAKTRARMVLMSGSPRPGTAHELFAPVFLLDQGQRLGKTLTGFRAEYLEPNKQNRHTGQIYSWRLRPGMEAALYGRIADLYFAVAPDLGLQSVTIDREVTLPASVGAMCQSLRGTQVIDLDVLELTAASQGSVEGKLHQICQGAVFDDAGKVVVLHDEKLDELEDLVNEIDGPLIIAYWYTHDLERLQRRFPKAVDIATDDGLAAAKAGRVQLALLHPQAAGHGVDGLQAHFSAIVWFAVPASFELYDQANKRIVRSGQREIVRIYRIVAANGLVDPKAIQRLADKEAEQDAFFQHLELRASA
jgi:hypothetical protein